MFGNQLIQFGMKRFLLKQIYVLACTVLTLNAAAQDIHFSQFYENATLRNPALVGIFSGDYKICANYRNQWSSFGAAFQTAMLNGETRVLMSGRTGDYMSFGASAFYDKAGSIDFTNTGAYASVAYNKALGDATYSYLTVGLGAGYLQRSMNAAKMRFANQYIGGNYSASNPTGEQINNTKVGSFDASAGVSLNSSIGWNVNYYLGAAAYHLSKPNQNYLTEGNINFSTRWTVSGGLQAAMAQNLGLIIEVNYQQQAPYEELIGGAMIRYLLNRTGDDNINKLKLYLGCYYRLNDAVIPTVKMDYHNWSLTASYDVTMGNQRIYVGQNGGYEMSLMIRGFNKISGRARDIIVSPRFELEDDPAKNPY